MDEEIQAIKVLPKPKSIRDLKGYLGLTEYYLKFIIGYARMAAPITDQLKKDCFFVERAGHRGFVIT